MRNWLIGGSVLALAAVPAHAQTSGSQDRGDDIIVTSPLLPSEEDALQGTTILSGEALTRDLRTSIGETLARQRGVSATSFGPNASRPILRGFQGERIRVLTEGIGSIDVSNTSVDHAVVIDPLLAERIEVVRGPSALLYGSSAIGGVVNVIDRRIPRARPDGGARIDAIASYGSAADERQGAAAGDIAIGEHFVLHADGSYLKSGNLRTGGFLLSPAARAAARSQIGLPQEVEDGEEPIDFAANAALRGKLPNSAAETWTAGVGASIVTDTGHLGISYSHYDSLYGVPVRYATAVGQEQEAPRIDIKQNRFDLRAEVETGGGFFERIRLRAGHADYRHFELEENGDVGTAFYNNGLEGRAEVVQADHGGWRGATGVQYLNRRFDVIGDEAFLPRNLTDQVGLFTLQSYTSGPFRAEAGGRVEWTSAESKVIDGDLRFTPAERNFTTWSGSIGGSYEVSDGVRLGLSASRTARAPSSEELFANGPHAGTQAYELGDANFRQEKSWGLEAIAHAHTGPFTFEGSVFYNDFSNFISEDQVDQAICEAAAAPSGRDVDLPCYQYRQGDARYWGAEAQASARVATFGDYGLVVDALGDYVRASRKAAGPVPRIPPLRLLGGVELQGETLTARAEVEHAFEQDRVAAFETTTPAYTVANASVAFRPFGDRATLLVSANNIFDVVARRHASFLKDFAPLAGRDIRATVRVGF